MAEEPNHVQRADSMSIRPTYARDLWDTAGLKQVSERIERGKKAMKIMHSFFQDASGCAYKTSQKLASLPHQKPSDHEIGTLKFVIDRYVELIETMAKNEEILSSKLKTNCMQKLYDQMKRFDRQNAKLLADVNTWHKSLQKEERTLNKAKQTYVDRKSEVTKYETSLNKERKKLEMLIQKQNVNKIPQCENNILSLQNKIQSLKESAKDGLELYFKAISHFRGFRIKFDSTTSSLLDQLEWTEKQRMKMFHKLLMVSLEIQHVMAKQSVKNIDTIMQHVSTALDPDSDNMLFVEKARSNKSKPVMPDPELYPDDEVERIVNTDEEELEEHSPMVQKWCEQWRFVLGTILSRDVDLLNQRTENGDNGDASSATPSFIKLTESEYDQIRQQCLESLNSREGRMAFAILLNRQRNADHGKGLELDRKQYFELVQLLDKFFDAVNSHQPVDVKPAKLVMIMTQSLYVKKATVMDHLTDIELREFEESQSPKKQSNQTFFNDESPPVTEETTPDKTEEKTDDSPPKPNDDTQTDTAQIATPDNPSQETAPTTPPPTTSAVDSSNSPPATHPSVAVTMSSGSHTSTGFQSPPPPSDALPKEKTKPKTTLSRDSNQHERVASASYLPKKNKLFLVDRIKNHQVWKSEKFWREAFCESVQQELKKYPVIQKWHSAPEQEEGDRRNQQILFAQMAAWTHNMKEFGMDDAIILKFLDTQDIPPDQKMILQATIGVMDGPHTSDTTTTPADKDKDENETHSSSMLETPGRDESAADSTSPTQSSTQELTNMGVGVTMEVPKDPPPPVPKT